MKTNTKVHIFLIHKTKETAAFTDMNRAYAWINTWFLTMDETEILIGTGVYNHDELGLIEFIAQDLNPMVFNVDLLSTSEIKGIS